MAVGFRRRLAALIVTKASSYLGHKELSCPCSASLPGRFHPIVTGLHDSTNALLEWAQAPAPAQATCTAWIADGMDCLGNLLSALTDLLHHPQVQDPEQRRCQTASWWMDRLLRDLVLLADAHSCFSEVLVSLKQLLAEAQAAVRHHDTGRLAAAMGTRHRSDRALCRLAYTLRALSHHRSPSSTVPTSDSGEDALAKAVAAATCGAAAGSAAIFAGLASASSSSALRALTSPMAVTPAVAMKRLQRLEDCVVATEDGCEQVHRALVNMMESVLNARRPC
jgi:hypothetical protein